MKTNTKFRSKLAVALCAAVVLPVWAAEVVCYEYMTITGSSATDGVYVLTDYVPKSNTVVRAKYASSSAAASNANQFLFCSRLGWDANPGKPHFSFAPNVNGKFRFDYHNLQSPASSTFTKDRVYELEVSGGKASVSDTTTSSEVALLGPGLKSFTPEYETSIFQAYMDGGTYQRWGSAFHGKFYYLKIYDIEDGNEVLKHHFVPCEENGVAKLCDLADGNATYSLTATGNGSAACGGSQVGAVAWTGATDCNWTEPTNWDGGNVPTDNDDVRIPSGVANMPVLSSSTPTLGNVVIEGTLTMTNWTTCLNAATVRIASGGILTCAGPFTDTEMSNRVWVACTDFTLLSGGKVDVTDKGYGKPTDVPIAAGAAWGPGKALGKKNGGAHGGYGGGGWSGDGTIYDSVDEPVAPGSTGKTLNGTAYAKGIPAGGAVRIDASGIVTINGAITANGHKSDSGNNSGAGSGGSILIYANRIVANGGNVEANGGNAGEYTYAAPAGGGRIALHYDTSAETEEDLVKLSVSASGGRCYRDWGTVCPIAQADHKGSADIGTIWFSDTKPLSFLGTSLTGQIYLGSGASYSCDSITMTNGWVRFAQEGFALTVAGDVTVSGTRARLEIGGGTYYRDYSGWWYNEAEWIGSYHHLRSGATPWAFTVGGDVMVTEGARLDLYAAATNGTEAAGGTLAITGDLTVAADSKLYLSCDAMNGGAPLVKADNVSIAENAIVSADSRGFARANGPSNSRGAAGTTTAANADSAIGAGHGGTGNKANASNGQAFDDATRPSLPGAGGNYSYEGGSEPLSGGGVVHLVAANAMTVNGTVSANAYTNLAYGSNGRSVGGAGGTVLLEAKTFAMGSTAAVLANGSGIKSSGTAFHNAGCGGGGRIAVFTGKPYVEGETTARQLTVTDVKPAGLLGTFGVEGGYFTDSSGNYRKYDGSTYLATSEKSEATVRGEDGTVRFCYVDGGAGFIMVVW